VKEWEQADLAWDLAEAVGPLLDTRERARIFAAIGAGETGRAIVTLLAVGAADEICVAPALVDKLARWLSAYTRSEAQPRLRRLVERLTR
jgi:hypothetical protein